MIKTPWAEIADAIGIGEQASVLPATIQCLLCRQPGLKVYADHEFGGQWGYCNCCGFAGNAIALVAAVTKTTLAEAAARFVPASQVQESVRITTEIASVSAFWSRVCKIPVSSFFSQVDGLIRTFNLVDSTAPQSRLFCLVAKHELVALLGRDRVGRIAGDWKVGMVMPYWDMPGRIRSFLIMTDTESAVISPRYRRGLPPGGFGMLTTTTLACRRFVIDEPSVAVRLQARHLSSSTSPLPIAVPPPASVAVSEYAQLVAGAGGWACWSPDPVRAARLAYALDGTAVPATADLTVDKMLASMRKIGAVKTLDRVATESVSKQRAAIIVCDHSGSQTPLATLRAITTDPIEESAIIRSLAAPARDRLVAERRLTGKSIRINGKELIDTGKQWKLPSGELIADGSLVIKRTVLRQPEGTIYYDGEIRHRKGKPVAFFAKADDFDVDPFRWVRAKMLYAGFAFNYDSRWTKFAISAAQQLRPPTVTTFSGIGWNADLCGFLFPRVTIDGNGARQSPPTPAEPRMPCGHFRYGVDVDTVAMGRPESAITWATIACVITSAISYAHGLVAPNFAVIGNQQHIAAAAAAAGCPSVSAMKPWRHVRAINRIEESGEAHRWPHRVIRHPTYRYRLAADLIEALPPGWFAPIEPVVADTLLLRGGWCSIDVTSPGDDTISAAAADTIVAFLSSLCQKGFQLPTGDTQLSRVIAALESWFAPQGSLSGIVAAKRLLYDDTPAQALSALGRLMASAVFNVKARVGVRDKVTSNYFDKRNFAWTALVDESNQTFMIPVTAVLESIATWSKFPIDRATVEARLVATGVVTVDKDYWLTPLDWWSTTMLRYKRKTNG